jgi:recombination protein RecR
MSVIPNEPFNRLVEELQKMPTVGPKTAQRLAFHILGMSRSDAVNLTSAITDVKEKVTFCENCFFITVGKVCPLCQDENRQRKQLCVVADSRDLLALEKSREYRGLYHVLGGVISPLDGLGPDNLRIKELLTRIAKEGFEEVIMALNPTVEGEATILYLSKLIQPLGIMITRLAYGLPMGSDLDYADELTLGRSIAGRQAVS